MSKELEALENIKHYDNRVGLHEDDYKVIEQALKEYEMEHTLRIRLENINYELGREKERNEKKLKALEIISRKGVNTLDVMESENYGDYIKIEKQYYYDHYIEGRMPDFDDWFETWVLTKTEYELLKEVLL